MIFSPLSLSMVSLSTDHYEKLWLLEFSHLKTTLQQALAKKTYLDALVLLYLGCIFVKRSERSNISIHSKF